MSHDNDGVYDANFRPRTKELYLSPSFRIQYEEKTNADDDQMVILIAEQPRVYIPKSAARAIARFVLFNENDE